MPVGNANNPLQDKAHMDQGGNTLSPGRKPMISLTDNESRADLVINA